MTVLLHFEDGTSVSLRHKFEETDSKTWSWTESLNHLLGGLPVHFVANVFDSGPDWLMVRWSFDDREGPVEGFPADGEAFRDLEVKSVRTFEVPRRGPAKTRVSIQVVDGNGGGATDEITLTWDGGMVSAGGLAPRVEPLSSIEVYQGSSVPFTAVATSSTQRSATFSWDLGDGTKMERHHVEHIYQRPGSYLAKVSAKAAGETTVRGLTVIVHDVAPRAIIRVKGTGMQDELLILDALLSKATPYDRSGLLYHWDLGDGTEVVGSTIEHIYTRSGSFHVTLAIVDPQGSTDRAERWIDITNEAPRILPSPNYAVLQDEVVRVEAPVEDTASDLPRLSYRWKVGEDLVFGRSLTLSFREPGSHSIEVEVSDGRETIEASVFISVANQAPSVHTTSITQYGPERSIVLHASGSDAPSDWDSLSFHWKFGDGQDAIGNPVAHQYPSTGRYVGELTVSDPWGQAQSLSFQVEVTYDADGDGLSREVEVSLGTSDVAGDTDGDGILDGTEHLGLRGYITNPNLADTDGDDLWDGYNITVSGVLHVGEKSVGTDPTNPDTDGDNLTDGAEIEGWDVTLIQDGELTSYWVQSDPLHPDVDEDGLTDYVERFLGTDPRWWDTDQDGLWDDEDPDANNDDTDGDGVSDSLDRAPDSTTSLNFQTKFPPGLVRFRQPFSVFSVEGIYAWVYQYHLLDNACYFSSDQTEESTRSSVVNETTVLEEIERTFQEGGEFNYTATGTELLYEQGTTFLYMTYGECELLSPKQYKFSYAVVENKWDVDFVNAEEVEVSDGFGEVFQYTLEKIPVRRGHPISLVLQYSIPKEEDKTLYQDAENFRVGAFGYSVFTSDAATEEALYVNTAVAGGLEEGSYQVEIKIPGSVTSEAQEDEGGATLTLLLLSAWLEVHPYSISRQAWDLGSAVWASLSLKVPLSTYQVIPKLAVDIEDLKNYVPDDLEELETAIHLFGPYRVYLYDVEAETEFEESFLTEVDTVVLVAVAETDIIVAGESIDWGPSGVWFEEQGGAFEDTLRWFKTVKHAGSLIIHFLNFKDVLTLQLQGAIELPELPSQPGERNARIEVTKVTQGDKVAYRAYRTRVVDASVPFAGGRRIQEVVRVESIGSFDDLDDIPGLGSRYVTLKAAVKGASVGVILVTLGRTGVVAFLEGDTIKGSVYVGATSTAILGTLAENIALKKLGLRGALGSVRLASVALIATGALLASYHFYVSATIQDEIAKLAHLEQASAFAIDTGILLIPGFGPAILAAWSITAAVMSVIMPNAIAAEVTSSPGSLVTFAFEYIFTGVIPSAISEDAFDQTKNWAISQMRQWNSVFKIPSIVILPSEDG